MYRNHTIAVVVPSYNEELLIRDTILSVPAFVDRIYAVNDASTDKTREIIETFSKKDARIIPINHKTNCGVGAAIVSGYKQAMNDGQQIIVVMAGDHQMDPDVMPALLDPIVEKKADYTKGNRLLSPEYRKGMSRWRFIGNTLLTIMTKFSSGYWKLMDPQNGYTAISRRALERLNLDGLYPRYGYCNDLLVKLNVFGFRVMDVEMPARYGRETSKIRYGNYIVNVSWLLFCDFFYRLRQKYIVLSFHPLVIFYLFGLAMTLIGVLAGLFTIYYVFIQGGPLFVRGVLSLLIFAIGLQFLSFALLFDIQESRDISLTDWEGL
ncbi:MAG: glycosyltransferase family 2 protein [Methanoregula sp.]|nr:glycosyltransferase family 2 protein [Methanoregula sp.]